MREISVVLLEFETSVHDSHEFIMLDLEQYLESITDSRP